VIQDTRGYLAFSRQVSSFILICEVIHPVDGRVICIIVYSDHKLMRGLVVAFVTLVVPCTKFSINLLMPTGYVMHQQV